MGISVTPLSERVKAVLAIPDQHPWAGTVPAWLKAAPGTRGIQGFIDHTLLRPEATRHDIEKVAEEGKRFGVAAVCVNGRWVTLVSEILKGTSVKVCAVVGFPLGAMRPEAKASEAAHAIADGASEIDMVLSIGDARAGEWAAVRRGIEAVRAATEGRILKVILETAVLAPEVFVEAAFLAKDLGADFIKTSTGFSSAGGATERAVRLMRRAVGDDFGVKASGGVRTAEMAIRMLAAGANRLGMSSTPDIAAVLGPNAPTLEELFASPPEPSAAPVGF